ncbi:MAG: UbiD family decarboxylase [Planctomycetales bacterium]
MPYDSLSDFLNDLTDAGELVRIAAEVEPVLEISEITDRVCKSPGGGPALFFERVRGSTMPVAINLLGSYRRMCRALGVQSFEELAEHLTVAMQAPATDGWLEKLRRTPALGQSGKWSPRVARSGACQQVIKLGRDVDLGELPALQGWPLDEGRSIPQGCLFSRSPQGGALGLGLCPVLIADRATCRLHWDRHQEAYRHFLEYRRLAQPMPVAIVLGGDPALPFLAAAPLEPPFDACQFGGFLRGQGLELVKCRSIDLDVPASCELVIEGHIDPTEPWHPGGSLGASSGFYSLGENSPQLQVTAVTHRANPVFPTTLVGKPPMEDFWLGKALERVFLPLIKLQIPELVDCNLPRAGAFHNLAMVSIRKTYPQQARKVMNALWGLRQMMFSKIVIVVDEQVDVHDEESVWFQVGANVHPARDVVFNEGPAWMLDHAAPMCGVGQKLGIDATRKFPEEGHPRPWPNETQMPRDIQALVTGRWSEYGLGPLLPESR